jgi:predicted nucleic acid-binding protein
MKIFVHDASVLIDLAECGLLEAWLELGNKTLTTSLIFREVNRKNQKTKLQRFIDKGVLVIEPLGAEALTEVVQILATLPARITIEDASAIFIAETRKAVLLTGDKVLRQCAENRKIDVHGLLWVFDMLVSRGAVLSGVAADRLEKLCERGAIRLPINECKVRIKKWRSR